MPGRINKNRKPHVIPLVGPLEPIVNMLAEMRKSFPKPEEHVLDFTNHRNIWNQVCAELGFGQYDKKARKYEGLLMHDFRRSAARNLLKMGVRKELAKSAEGTCQEDHRPSDRCSTATQSKRPRMWRQNSASLNRQRLFNSRRHGRIIDTALSSRGLGRDPLKVETRVRFPLALPTLLSHCCRTGIDRVGWLARDEVWRLRAEGLRGKLTIHGRRLLPHHPYAQGIPEGYSKPQS
jgi:hypothetical protein